MYIAFVMPAHGPVMKKHSVEENEALTQKLTEELKLAARWGGLLPRTDGRRLTDTLSSDEAKLHEMAIQGNLDADDRLRAQAHVRLLLLLFAIESDENYADRKLSNIEQEYLHRILKDGRRVRPVRKRGRDRSALVDRNRRIVYFVKWVVNRGYDATRNRASIDRGGDPSACAIVADAMSRRGFPMTERAVEAIWEKRERGRQYPRHRRDWNEDDADRAALGIGRFIELPEAAKERDRAWLRTHPADEAFGNPSPRPGLPDASPKK
jgi:hypothetical protein